jgi:hypothetical protein
MYNNITVEQLEQLEQQRNSTYADPLYQAWMKELNVSRMYVDNTGIQRAVDIMALWDNDAFSRKCRQNGILYRLIKQ